MQGTGDARNEPRRALDAVRLARADLTEQGRWREADEVVLRGIDHLLGLPEEEAPDPSGLVHIAGGPRPEDTDRRADQPLSPSLGAAVQAMVFVNRGHGREAAAERARRALAEPGAGELGPFWISNLALVYCGEAGQALESCERTLAVEGPSNPRLRHAAELLAARAEAAGGPESAHRRFQGLLDEEGHPWRTGLVVAWTAAALVDRGEADRAGDLLEGRDLGATFAGQRDRAELLHARAGQHLAVGRAAQAYEDFVECGRELARVEVVNPAVLPWRSQAALSAAAIGRRNVALALAQKELVDARRWGTPAAVGIALRAAALVSGDVVRQLTEAAELLERAGVTFELVRTRCDLGAKLCHDGQRSRGLEVLAAARDHAPAGVWRNRAEEALRRFAGEESDLSDQELRVAHLARAGVGNRDIARGLHLVVRTVEFHLSNIYRKLGVSGRTGLSRTVIPPL
ncbi:helix-turn-helix transcriptional regulator [Lentzea sp. NBRC 102530]|uniref:helix-turn-helix domain-containing protein n=1 Tax=Lentzea sp. NBRC 102530 TaxID=3032201 RepID=UPI0025566243|nr:helix-turn-helix transcriptional regulator [Lentzea sp. NBRC 102530]